MKLSFQIGSVLCDNTGEKIADIIRCQDGLYTYHDHRRHIVPKMRYGTLADAVDAAAKSLSKHSVQIDRIEISPFVFHDYFHGKPHGTQQDALRALMALDPSIECGASMPC